MPILADFFYVDVVLTYFVLFFYRVEKVLRFCALTNLSKHHILDNLSIETALVNRLVNDFDTTTIIRIRTEKKYFLWSCIVPFIFMYQCVVVHQTQRMQIEAGNLSWFQIPWTYHTASVTFSFYN